MAQQLFERFESDTQFSADEKLEIFITRRPLLKVISVYSSGPARLTLIYEKATDLLGKYVRAPLALAEGSRQGVLVEIHHDGTFVLRGQGAEALYVCKGPPIVIPDNNLDGETRQFVQDVRRELSW